MDTDNNGSLDSFAQLTTTAPHPFYVQGQNAFVEAQHLQLGDEFRLTDGRSAELVDVEIEEAVNGNPFTTYNFEVADFHTYFVGTDGVWVHNSSNTACQRVLSVFERAVAKYSPDDPIAGYAYVRQRLPQMTEETHAGFVQGTLTKIKEMKDAGTLKPHLIELGTDADSILFREREVFAGARFEATTGRTLRRPVFGESGDFVDQAGVQWDAKGPYPVQASMDDPNGVLANLREHFQNHSNGDEKLLVDLAGLDTLKRVRIMSLLSNFDSGHYHVLE